jgi:hypothetical protein
MKMQLIIKNEFGVSKSQMLEVDEEQYQKMLEISKDFHSRSFHMDLEDNGGHVFIPPEIVKKSILIVKLIAD